MQREKRPIVRKNQARTLPIIGWREWIVLPDLKIDRIKAKVDSGARSSSLHAVNIKRFTRNGETWVRFQIHPLQRTSDKTVSAEARLLEYRSVRSSSGKAESRPVILTKMMLHGVTQEIELTLTSRAEMGFRMLLGREAFRGRFLVDVANSYYSGRPARRKPTKPLKSNHLAHSEETNQ